MLADCAFLLPLHIIPFWRDDNSHPHHTRLNSPPASSLHAAWPRHPAVVSSSGGAVPRHVVARGGWDEVWGPCGARGVLSGCHASRHAALCLTILPYNSIYEWISD